jgi:hypothetical protein
MHIASHGDAVEMAKAIHNSLLLTKTPSSEATSAVQAQPGLGFDEKQVEQIIGHTGKVNGGVLQIGVPRSETISDSGMVIPASMGVATALNLQPTGNGKRRSLAISSCSRPKSTRSKALRENRIEVTALHNHMLMEGQRLFFMHLWANDDAVKLAKGLRVALDQTNSAR